ncbi:hypothetical protein ASPCAL10208 [Aspergillus calidoustus]|uniref:Uncharacterized protein n=1 Tax=Aspergillus calidoustus TaxID=454130 RepID=A0A0U5G601_ASPCI|nr:hypothetical protein ASPCAL10208 [Aspergillus calidoustus]
MKRPLFETLRIVCLFTRSRNLHQRYARNNQSFVSASSFTKATTSIMTSTSSGNLDTSAADRGGLYGNLQNLACVSVGVCSDLARNPGVPVCAEGLRLVFVRMQL